MSGVGQEEDKKPADSPAHINVKVKGQDGNEVFFRIKRISQLKKLMETYCDRQSVDINAIAFLFDGRRLRPEQTPDELEMEDGDEIDAMLHQTGGAKAKADRQNQRVRMSSAGQDEDKKPGDSSSHINVKVKGQDGNEVFFRIKKSSQLKKLMTTYCDRQSVDLNAIAFLFDGRRLRAEQTPDELEMEDGDEIDAMLHQTGGSTA
ncbi:Small ubiquitin-related modifier 1 [Forsythia ovata]|uniref:Small ubiquitin-related modifier 1 n=1 Tax=Forsythia ovata TaxID=205694 RepID=A0ABD1Q9S1_9LAMI